MFLNVGGAVLGVAFITLISDSVSLKHGSGDQARLDGYRAGYYYALGLSALATIPSVFGMPSGRLLAAAETKNEGRGPLSSESSHTPPNESIKDELKKGDVSKAREDV
jgi:hypothetical protein